MPYAGLQITINCILDQACISVTCAQYVTNPGDTSVRYESIIPLCRMSHGLTNGETVSCRTADKALATTALFVPLLNVDDSGSFKSE